MAPTEGRFAMPEWRWDCRRGTSTGINANKDVNVEDLHEIGKDTVRQMDPFTFRPHSDGSISSLHPIHRAQ